MIRLVWRTDVHCADHTPASRTDDWVEAVMDKLVQVGNIARSVKATAVLDGGDFFDPKPPIRTSHRLIQRIIRAHENYPCPVYGNVGNHDCRLSQISALPESPLGTLFETGIFQRNYFLLGEEGVSESHEALFEDSVKVQVVGIPYHGPRYNLDYFKRIQKPPGVDYLIVNAHLLASPHGGSMFAGEDIVRYADLPELCPDADVFCFGHWHKNQGVVEIAPGKWVVNIGSLTRGSLNQDNVDRIPAVAIMSFEESGVTIETRNLEVKPASEVFDMEKRVREEERAMTMDAFVTKIQTNLQKNEEKAPLEDAVRGMDLPAKVRDRSLFYMEKAKPR